MFMVNKDYYMDMCAIVACMWLELNVYLSSCFWYDFIKAGTCSTVCA